jgi:GNAT superfamily N-acetyltransferase
MAAVEPGKLVLLALDRSNVVGHAMAVWTGEHTANIGIVVTDGYQRRGIGDRLLGELTETAAALGVTEFCCDVLSENYFVRDWLHRALPGIRFDHSSVTMTGRWVNRPVIRD